jgi:hypothetical protein
MKLYRHNAVYKNFLFLLLVCILFNVTACAKKTKKDSTPVPQEQKEQKGSLATDTQLYGKTLVRTELIFGLSKPDGEAISEVQWQKFLDDFITPKFKEGLTVLDANGQYQTQNKEIIKEKAKILILLYEDNEEVNAAIESIRAAYKEIFQQESVLRVSATVGVSF